MPEEPTTRQLVVLSLGQEEYALPLQQVHEIIRFVAPRTVACADPSIRGVISQRGKLLPVFDLATRLRRAPAAPDIEPTIVIVQTSTGRAGVIVDAVEEVLTVDVAQVRPAPVPHVPSIAGVAQVGDRVVFLLNPDGIVTGDAAEDLPAAA